MKGRTELLIFLTSVTALVAFVYLKPSPEILVNSVFELVGLVIFAAFTIALIYYQLICPLKRRLALHRQEKEEVVLTERQLNVKKIQREQVQNEYLVDSAAYEAKQKNKREAALRKKEQDFYKFMNPVFSNDGQILNMSTTSDHRQSSDVNRDAATRRHIAEPSAPVKPAEAKSETENRLRQKVVLPDEPLEGDPNSVIISLRTPHNRIHRRRFLSSTTFEVLQSYMSSVGYSPLLYHLMFPYPLTPITAQPETTLHQLGLNKPSVLLISRTEE